MYATIQFNNPPSLIDLKAQIYKRKHYYICRHLHTILSDTDSVYSLPPQLNVDVSRMNLFSYSHLFYEISVLSSQNEQCKSKIPPIKH